MASTTFNWLTTEGYDELDRIAREKLHGITLHKWQREGAAQLLNGIDILLLVATGSGKSTLFYLYALARPQDIVLVISPLKLLQSNMVTKLKEKGLSAVALNADTISAAEEAGRDVWAECTNGQYKIILCSPEQLDNPKTRELIESNLFQRQLSLVVVDEVHLIPTWGGEGPGTPFRSAYNAIGTLRARLQLGTVFLGLSATLMPGKPTDIVVQRLKFREGKFKLMREDCERTNLHITIRRIQHPYTQNTFADLDWLVPHDISDPVEIPKTVIYLDSIARGHSVTAYLQSLLPASLLPISCQIIRHLYAGTCDKCKDEASDEFLKASDTCTLRVVVATEAFGCGVDIPDIHRVVNFGTPQNLPILLQRFGRTERCGKPGFCYVYVSPKLWILLLKELGSQGETVSKRLGTSKTGTEAPEDESAQCCPFFKQIVVLHLQRRCISHRIIELFNPELEKNKPTSCMRCSGCVEDDIPSPRSSVESNEPGNTKRAKVRPKQGEVDGIPRFVRQGLRRPLKKDFEKVQASITEAARYTLAMVKPCKSGMFGGIPVFLPDAKSLVLSKRILDLQTTELVRRALGEDWTFWDTHGEILAIRVLDIRTKFIAELEASYKPNKPRRQAKQQIASEGEPESELENNSEAESEDPDASRPSDQDRRVGQAVFIAPGPKILGKRKERIEQGEK